MSRISKFFKKNRRGQEPENTIHIREYIAKRVKQDNSDIGESVAIEESRVVVKNSDVYMSIPLEKIIANTENIVVGDFNREESLQLGRVWFEKRDTLKFDKNGMMILGTPES
jgi:hypothetical protein